jgi:hypothetical protein
MMKFHEIKIWLNEQFRRKMYFIKNRIKKDVVEICY